MKQHIIILRAFVIVLISALIACTDTHRIQLAAVDHTGETVFWLSNETWLSVNEHNGTTIHHNSVSETYQQLAGEYADVRLQKGQAWLMLLLNDQQLTLVKGHSSNTQIQVKTSAPFDQSIEGLCLYQPAEEPLQVFLLAADHLVYQMLVNETDGGLDLILLRTLPLPPTAKYCAVDDRRHHFYVNEEDIGVWQYEARSESEIKRKAVALVAPLGNLKQDVGPISVVDQSLLLTEKKEHLFHRYALTDAQPKYQSTYTLPVHIRIDGLTATLNEGHVRFAVLDEVTERVLRGAFPVNQVSNQKMKASIVQVPVDAETQPVDSAGDAADDPAIWVRPSHPERSRILGTNKKQGLLIYNLKGERLQFLPVGRVNNVDLRTGFTYAGVPMDIAAASQRDRKAIALFKIDPQTGVVNAAEEITTTLNHVYGMCMFKGKNDQFYVFINDEDGRYEQWQIIDNDHGWQGKKVREFALASQPEGCTVNEKTQQLFVGEEAKGVWVLGAAPSDSTDMFLIADIQQTDLMTDVEGMEIYQSEFVSWLVVSSQGDDIYLVFQAESPYKQLGKFRLGMNVALGIDGASETDGLTVTSMYLGDTYPKGVMIAQDGRNLMPSAHQNFKIIDWRKIEMGLQL